MTPTTEQIHLEFDLSDKDIADFIYNSKPPVGVTISKPAVLIKASADGGGGVFVQLAIQFLNDFHDVGLGVLAAFIYDRFIKRDRKSCRINNKKTVLNNRNIRRLIKAELANQIAREKQRTHDKNRPPKKRP
jgi:hypothetical protein